MKEINVSCETMPYNNVDYGNCTTRKEFLEIMDRLYDDLKDLDNKYQQGNTYIKIEWSDDNEEI